MLKMCDIPDEIALDKYKTTISVSLSSFKGKTILLSFVNNGCGYCEQWLTHMYNLWQSLPVPNDIEFVIVFFNYYSNGYHDATDAMIDAKLASLGIANIPFTVLKDKAQPNSVAANYLAGFYGEQIGFPYSYIISKNYQIVTKWHRLSTKNKKQLSFDSGDMNSTQNYVEHRLNTLQHVKEPWDTVLVLDYSDTMNDQVALGSVTKKKVEFLQDAIEIFLNLWRDYAVCNDKVGVVFFRSQTETDNSLLKILDETVTPNNIQQIVTKVKTATAYECTAMGAGLATAIDMLQPGADKKFIVLFTDGMQNRNPLVCGTSSADMHIDNVGPIDYPPPLTGLCYYGTPDGGQALYKGTLPKNLNPALNIAIHTIGIGVYSGWQDTLANLSAATGGIFSAANTIWPNLVDYFVTSLIEFYRGSSLQMIMSNQQTLAVTELFETFLLNRCAGKLTVLLDWVDPEHRLTFRLVKDGKEIDIRYKITEGHTYRIATIYFPHYQTESGYMHTMTTHTVSQVPQELPSLLQDKLLVTSGEYIDPEGRWELIVRRQSPSDSTPVAYHVAVLVEDKIMEIIPERHPNVWYTGDLIPIEFQLREGRKPVNEVYSASATISSPVTSFANLLYKFQGRSGISGQIMRLLANSQAITGSLAKREEVIMPLQPKKVDKKNRVTQYSGTYERATVPGIYNLRLKVRGISAKCGMFERVENMSFVVKAKPDPSASSIKIIYDRAGNRLSVLIVPKDKYGNIVGPGYSRLLRYTHGGEPAGEIIDNLDGSYRVDIPKVKPADLDKVSVAVEMSNVVLFRGNPGKLVEKNLKK